jgi:hypothetical protein
VGWGIVVSAGLLQRARKTVGTNLACGWKTVRRRRQEEFSGPGFAPVEISGVEACR